MPFTLTKFKSSVLFTLKNNLKKLLQILAFYKINLLFHWIFKKVINVIG